MNNTDEMIEKDAMHRIWMDWANSVTGSKVSMYDAFVAGHAAASQRTDWIPTSERLPDKSGGYLVTQRHQRDVCIRHLNVHDEQTRQYWKNYFVAWMQIPAAFSKGEVEQKADELVEFCDHCGHALVGHRSSGCTGGLCPCPGYEKDMKGENDGTESSEVCSQ